MDQVSRPLQVVLAAAVVFAALWFLVLRPKPDSGSSRAPATPAGQPARRRQPGSSLPAGLGRSLAKAEQARGQADRSGQASEQAAADAGAPGATPPAAPNAGPAPATGAAAAQLAPAAGAAPRTGRAASAASSAGALLQTGVLALLPGEIARGARVRAAPVQGGQPSRRRGPSRGASPAAVTGALARGKVVVLLFWDRRGSDDRLVRDELRRVSTHHGRALVAAAPIRSVSGYGAVTRGVQVLESPTVLIVDRARRARVIAGYTDAAEIGQAVTEALTPR